MEQPDANTLPSGSTPVLSPTQLEDWLRLLLAPGLGATTLASLLQDYGDASRVIEAVHDGTVAISNSSRSKLLQSYAAHRDACLEWQSGKTNRHIICWNDPRYPALLREIPDPPALLFVEGDPGILQEPQVAIVGSRKATPPGLETTRNFARTLAQRGLVITSGLALGIDASAHIGALDTTGKTVAVLGNGLDRIYPARHGPLAEEIVANGAVISEFSPGTPPLAQNFPRRNRIISGLCLGVVVIEAAVRSGSLITARLAGEQGREVFAMPGSIHNPLARGCHRLLREGATLVECVDDILQELGHAVATNPGEQEREAFAIPGIEANAGEHSLLEHMGFDPVDTDTLVSRSGLTTERVSSMLLLLELQGNIAALGGGRFQRRDK